MSTTGNTARYEQEATDAAVGVIGRYVEPDTLAPYHAVNLDRLAVEKATAHPQLSASSSDDLALVMDAIRSQLKERAVSQLTRIGRVTLDTEGHYGPMAWTAADVPQIVFAALTSQDTGIRQLADSGDPAVVVLYFDPEAIADDERTLPVIDRDTAVQQIDRTTGEPMTKPNVYSADGYVAVVGFVSDLATAKRDMRELRDAVRTLAIDPEGDDEADDVEAPPVGSILTSL